MRKSRRHETRIPRVPALLAILLLIAVAADASSGEEAAAAAAPPAEAAIAPVEALHAALLDVMKRAETLGFAGRVRALDPVVRDAYDLDFMAARTLGRHWRKLETDQQTRWRNAFRELTVATYANRFTGYGGERFETLGSDAAPHDTALVHTRIVPADEPAVALDYRVRPTDAGYRIVDVYLNGTVSELALRRSDYSSLLKREGFDALMEAIEARTREAAGGVAAEGR